MNNSNEVKEIWHVNDRLIFSDKRGKAVAEAIVDYSKEDGIFRAQDNAKLICKAVNEYDKLKEDNAALLDALKTSVNVIKDWHGAATFDIYYDHAPEMKLIRETLTKAEAFKK